MLSLVLLEWNDLAEAERCARRGLRLGQYWGHKDTIAISGLYLAGILVAAGNPARVVKKINPHRRMLKRELMFRDAEHYYHNQDELDRYMLANNGWWNWLRSVFFPNKSD